MDNNKNRMKDRPKSNPELRKMYSEHGADIGHFYWINYN